MFASLIIGLVLGLVSGYVGGWLDRILVLIMDALYAFPSFLLAIVCAFLFLNIIGDSVWFVSGGVVAAALSLTVIYIPQYFRVVRNTTISAKEATYVEAARALGASGPVIMRRYLFGNVIQSVPVIGTLNAADAILHPGRTRLPGHRHPARPGRRVGLRPAARAGRRRRRGLVDVALPRSGDRAAGHRADPGRRGPQRDGQPDPAAPATAARSCCRRGSRTAGAAADHAARPTPVDESTAEPLTSEEPAVTVDDRPPVDRDQPVIHVDDLRVWYGTVRGAIQAVDGVSLDLYPGETLGLVGESGCGKSTLGRGLMGLLPQGAKRDGEVLFKGRDILPMSDKEAYALRGPSVGMIFQEPLTRLNPLMRISQHFEETITQHEPDLSKTEVRERALEILRLMGIPPTRYKSYPHEFSGGMRQRLMIALALVLRPAFVVADEPTTALDVLVEAQIVAILNDLRRNFDTALLLITHNLGIVAEACDRVAVMYAGRIVEQGSVRDRLRQPAAPLHPRAAALDDQPVHHRPELHPRRTARPGVAAAGCRFHPRCPDAMVVCA